jgi:hypothetical protein
MTPRGTSPAQHLLLSDDVALAPASRGDAQSRPSMLLPTATSCHSAIAPRLVQGASSSSTS